MALPFDPFSPIADPAAFEQVQANLGNFMQNPAGRAALLSTGLALMQPPSFGDNAVSQLGRALGSAGETVNRTEAMDLKEREQDSKADLRSSQALAAESRAAASAARAETAGARLGTQAERLALAEKEQSFRQERALTGTKLRLAIAHQNYVKDVAKRNENARVLGGPVESVDPFPVWLEKNPALKSLAGAIGVGAAAAPEAEDEAVPAAASTTSQPPAAVAGTPAVGEIRKGHRFKGGNPADPASWEKI
jgi:hypothetical protein